MFGGQRTCVPVELEADATPVGYLGMEKLGNSKNLGCILTGFALKGVGEVKLLRCASPLDDVRSLHNHLLYTRNSQPPRGDYTF